MAFFKHCIVLAVAAFACGSPTSKPAFWKGTVLDSTVEEMRSLCDNEDAFACLKYKALSVLDTIFKEDPLHLKENIEINRNSYRSNDVSGRSENSIEENVEEYIKSHDVTFKLPVVGSKVTVGARNLDQDEVNLKVQFSDSTDAQARKSKLKKIFVPILVFVLLKAMTLIPLALGILGLKAWNALQLSFFSFVISVALAVFQLCKKLASDNAAPQIAAHGPWESAYASQYAAARAFEESPAVGGQDLAYAAYTPQ